MPSIVSNSRSLEREIFFPEETTSLGSRKIPFFLSRVSAGFPSPADDYVEKRLDVNELVIKHPAATFFVRAEGDSKRGAGVHNGDILIVDRSLNVFSGRVIIAVLNGELTVKRFEKKNGRIYLSPANQDFKSIPVTEEMDFEVWGVVTTVIHPL